MKIPKEYVLILIIGLFVLAYILDAVVNPLDANLPTPYHYFTSELLQQFPFTTASVFIKGFALFLTPLWLFSFFKEYFMPKAAALFILSALVQLYALQDVVTQAEIVPLEWSLSLTLAGMMLFLPSGIFFLRGVFASLGSSVSSAKMEAAIEEARAESEIREE